MEGLKTFDFLHQCVIYQTTGLWTTRRSCCQWWVFATELHCDVRPSAANHGQLPHNGLRTKSAHYCDDMPVSWSILDYPLSFKKHKCHHHISFCLSTRQYGKQAYQSYWPETRAVGLTFSSSRGKVKVLKIQETQNGPIRRRTLVVLPKNSTEVRVHVHKMHASVFGRPNDGGAIFLLLLWPYSLPQELLQLAAGISNKGIGCFVTLNSRWEEMTLQSQFKVRF